VYYLHAEVPATKQNKRLSLRWNYYGPAHEEAYVQPHHDGMLNPNYKSPDEITAEHKE